MLSIVIPFYDDVQEALDLAQLSRAQLGAGTALECILVGLDPARARTAGAAGVISSTRLILCDVYRGLAHGKKLGLETCVGDIVLFLMPGLTPAAGAIAR